MDRLIGHVAEELEELGNELELMQDRPLRLRKMLEESQTPELPGAEGKAESGKLKAEMPVAVSCRKCGDYYHPGLTGRGELCDKCRAKVGMANGGD